VKASELVKRQGVGLVAALQAGGVAVEPEAVEWAEIELKYEGYLTREAAAAARVSRMNDFALPLDLPYYELGSLSTEAREKLTAVRPSTLGQASRVPGVSASDLQNLLAAVARRQVRFT
jgi:tRNA uridine 5-carboxymethylaminomethyl modification enzyme